MEKNTNGKCLVCGGGIVEIIEEGKYVATGMMPIIGPGGRGQYADVSKGFHCKKCGIKYAFVPRMSVSKGRVRKSTDGS